MRGKGAGKSMETSGSTSSWLEDDRIKMAAMMREAYARVWYELAVALAVQGGYQAVIAGHSARKANLYRVEEQRWRPGMAYTHIVYHFFEDNRFLCTCQSNAARCLPCGHVGAAVLYLQARRLASS
jgi:hypothetical protein